MAASPTDRLSGDAAIDALARLHFTALEDALAAVSRTAARVLAVDRVTIWLFSNDLDCMHRVHEYPAQPRVGFALTLDLSHHPEYVSTLARESLYGLGTRAIRRLDRRGPFARYLFDHGVQTLLHGAIRIDGTLTGVICHEHASTRRWRAPDRRRVLRLGQIAARMIENDRRRRAVTLGVRFRDLIEHSVDAIAMADPHGQLDYVNPSARRLLGLAPDEPLMGLRLVDFLQPDSRARAAKRIYAAARQTGLWTGRLGMRTRRHKAFDATITLNAYRGAHGQVAFLSSVVRDLNVHPALERRRQPAAPHPSAECGFVINCDTLAILRVDHGFEPLLGYDAHQRRALTLFDLCGDPPDVIRAEVERARNNGHLLCGEKRVRHVKGHWVDAEISFMRLEHQGVATLSVGLRDISERSQRRRDIERMAYYDPLTGLANSNLLRERADAMLARSLAGGPATGFILLQLDHWQRILDIQGYQAAESLVLQVGNRLRRVFDKQDALLARLLGGAQFGVLYTTERDSPRWLLDTLHSAFRRPFRTGDESLHLNVRSGGAQAPADAVNFKDLTKRAGIALRNAQLRHRPHCEYESVQSSRLQDERLLEQDLRKAIGTRQILLRYQPVRAIGRGTSWAAVEVLARWRHPQLGLLAPDDFIPVAEDSTLIIELDRQILRRAAGTAAGWSDSLARLTVAVNLSAITLLSPGLVDMVEQALHDTGLPASRLCVEITETAIMKDRLHAAAQLAQVKALGVYIAMDDFGTGYSSLAYLKDLPVDALKIDRDFVRGIGADSRDESTIETIIRLGHDLGMQVLAEGVETRFQLDWLGQRDIDYVQGYYVGVPLKITDLNSGRTRTRRSC